MHSVTDEQVDFILNDIAKRGVVTEDVKYNILDHVCCIIENEMSSGEDFYEFYRNTIARFYKKELKEIEDETRELITFKYYYAMKRTLKITGLISVLLILFGSILKIQHLPGAGISLVSGFTFFSLVFIPLLIIMKFRDDKVKKNRVVVTMGMILTLTGTIGMLMKLMHWPFANYLFFGSLLLFGTIFIPVYFFSRYKDPELKFNTTINTVFMIAAAGMLFALTNIKNSRKFEDSIVKMEQFQSNNIKEMRSSNDRLSEFSYNDVAESLEINLLTLELQNTIKGIRVNLISESEDISTEAAEHYNISDVHFPNDFKVVTEQFEKNKGEFSLEELEKAVERYNTKIEQYEEPDILHPIDLNQLQMTQTTLSVVLNQLADIEMQALANENSFLSYNKGLFAGKLEKMEE